MNQPAYSKKFQSYFLGLFEISLGSCLCHGPRINFFNPRHNELVGNLLRAFTKSSGSLVLISCIPSYFLFPDSVFVFALTLFISFTNNKLFKQFLTMYLVAQIQLPILVLALALIYEFWKQLLKACFSKIYLDNLHLKCYIFYQQCKNYFDIAIIIKPNQIPFATLFLYRLISCKQIQYKT